MPHSFRFQSRPPFLYIEFAAVCTSTWRGSHFEASNIIRGLGGLELAKGDLFCAECVFTDISDHFSNFWRLELWKDYAFSWKRQGLQASALARAWWAMPLHSWVHRPSTCETWKILKGVKDVKHPMSKLLQEVQMSAGLWSCDCADRVSWPFLYLQAVPVAQKDRTLCPQVAHSKRNCHTWYDKKQGGNGTAQGPNGRHWSFLTGISFTPDFHLLFC